jgi:hypothetical protein
VAKKIDLGIEISGIEIEARLIETGPDLATLVDPNRGCIAAKRFSDFDRCVVLQVERREASRTVDPMPCTAR